MSSTFAIVAVVGVIICGYGDVSSEAPLTLDRDNHDVDDTNWIRLCTLTSNGGSRHNVTMPCAIRVGDDDNGVDDWEQLHGNSSGAVGYEGNPENTDGRPTNEAGYEFSSADGRKDVVGGGKSAGANDDGKDLIGGGETDDAGKTDDVGQTDDVSQTVDVTVETADDDDVDKTDDDDDKTDDDVGETDDVGQTDDVSQTVDVTVETADDDDVDKTDDDVDKTDDDVGKTDDGLKHRPWPGNVVKKVMLSYLMDARNRLYDKIHYLLDLLQNSFLNAKLNRRTRRASVERQMIIMNNNKRRQRIRKKQQSITSIALEPTFERSMMTMSFLMFGVFVIQVVQRLMQTLKQSDQMPSMGN